MRPTAVSSEEGSLHLGESWSEVLSEFQTSHQALCENFPQTPVLGNLGSIGQTMCMTNTPLHLAFPRRRSWAALG